MNYLLYVQKKDSKKYQDEYRVTEASRYLHVHVCDIKFSYLGQISLQANYD